MSRSGIEYFFAFYSAMSVRRRPKCCRSHSDAPPGMLGVSRCAHSNNEVSLGQKFLLDLHSPYGKSSFDPKP